MLEVFYHCKAKSKKNKQDVQVKRFFIPLFSISQKNIAYFNKIKEEITWTDILNLKIKLRILNDPMD